MGTPSAGRFAAERWQWQHLRPGVTEDSLLRSCRRIQRAWRELVQHRHVKLARQRVSMDGCAQHAHVEPESHTGGGYAHGVHGVLVSEQRAHAPADEDLWDEAVFFHHPPVDDVLSELVKHEASAAILGREPAASTILLLRKLERQFQLRSRGSAPWRPPCALGETGRQELQEACRSGLDRCRGDIEVLRLLMPIACSIRLVVASSYVHSLELQRASAVLSELEAPLPIPGGSVSLEVLSQPILSRATLLRSRVAWLSGGAASAEAAARDALQLLEETRSSAFWPPHPWELAACHRLLALSLCRAGRPARALGELQGLGQLLVDTPGLLADLLHQDVQVLQLEVEVALDVDLRCSDKGNVQASVLQSFIRRADALLKTSTHLPCACRLLALAAKLALLAEIPWYVAGGARAEVVKDASDRLEEASVVEPHRVLAAQAVCAALSGDEAGALAAASAWAVSQDTTIARRLVSELRQPAPSKRALSQIMTVCLAQGAILQGVCTPSAQTAA
ncbi:Lpcat2b [Symbiodinium natans]|uniref:Lpcat2b protein n=1 Tax=Symbiodinium natans TaxID=878477 RepID=A0A812IMV8_9DINO|nr:Lpcat2b [Symbiodinium natans]